MRTVFHHFVGTIVVLFAMLMLSAGGALVQAAEYRLGQQDRVLVTVFGEPDLSGEFEIDGEGKVALPLIGEVALGGLTPREAESAIVDKLQPDYLRNPRVSIQVANYRPFYILGEVKTPGGYPYVGGMTVVQAVALAGGFTYRARQSRLRIIRSDEHQQIKIPATRDTPILPGDVIEVPERFF